MEELYHNALFLSEYASSCVKGHRSDHRVPVPAISLESVIALVPATVRIAFVKVDAQGVDEQILATARSQMHRIENVIMEAQDLEPDEVGFLYEGGGNLKALVSAMRSHAFVPIACRVDSCVLAEFDCFFGRAGDQSTAFRQAVGSDDPLDLFKGASTRFLPAWVEAVLGRTLGRFSRTVTDPPGCRASDSSENV